MLLIYSHIAQYKFWNKSKRYCQTQKVCYNRRHKQTTNLFTCFIKIYVAYIDNYSIQILKINQKGIVKLKKFAIIDDINKAVINQQAKC